MNKQIVSQATAAIELLEVHGHTHASYQNLAGELCLVGAMNVASGRRACQEASESFALAVLDVLDQKPIRECLDVGISNWNDARVANTSRWLHDKDDCVAVLRKVIEANS